MLPWNPPSSFSLQPEQRYNPYHNNHDNNPAPHQQPSPQQQQPQQQQQQQGQQQQGNNNNGGQPAGPPPSASQAPYPPMTLAATLHFLQSEHRRYARDRNEWEIERAEMRARIALLEGEKRGSEGALKSLGRRCKMLEMALRGERSKFLSTTNALASNASPSASGTASPVPGLAKDATLGGTSGPGGIPPAKLAALHKDASSSSLSAPVTPAEAPATAAKSAAMQASSSSPGQGGAKTDTLNVPAGANGFATGTWSAAAGGAAAAAARDPRGKARSREYLKQCLQEITYLTSSTTLNPLSSYSYAAPSVPRPHKSLPDTVPTAGGAGVIALPPSSTAAAPAPVPGEVQPFAESASAPSTAPAPPISAPPPASSAAPVDPTPAPAAASTKTSLLSSFPSDPPSAFVPLKRQISQPGQSVRGASQAASGEVPEFKTGDAEEGKKEEKGQEAEGESEQEEMDRQIREMSGEALSSDSASSSSSDSAPPAEEVETPSTDPVDAAAELDSEPAQEKEEEKEFKLVEEDVLEPPQEPREENEPEPEPVVERAEEVVNAAPGAGSEKGAAPAPPAEAPTEDVQAEQNLAELAEKATPEVEDEKPGAEEVEVVQAARGEEAGGGAAESEVAETIEKQEEEEETKKDDHEEEPLPLSSELASTAPSLRARARVETSTVDGSIGPGASSRGGLGGLFPAAVDGAEHGEGGGQGGEGGGGGDLGLSSASELGQGRGEGEGVTALFAPSGSGGGGGGGEEWRAKLREAGRRAYPSLASVASAGAGEEGGGRGGDKELEGLTWDLEERGSSEEGSLPRASGGAGGKKKKKGKKGRKEPSEDAALPSTAGAGRFSPRRVLKSHLEAVRAVEVFEDQEKVGVVSAGDDFTVKVWRDVKVGTSSSRSDLQPIATFRGHVAPVTALAVSSFTSTIFSASLDSTIRLWRLPSPSSAAGGTYAAHDPALALGVLDPKADAVWGLAVFRTSSGEERLAAITADGSVQVWDVQKRELERSWTYGAASNASSSSSSSAGETDSLRKRLSATPVPTALVVLRGGKAHGTEDGREYLVVGFQNAVVKVYEPESGREVGEVGADGTYDGTPETQLNALAVDSARGLLATAHEDRHIRVFDLCASPAKLVVETVAHLDGVTSLAFSPSSSSSTVAGNALLASTSHDASLRLWSLSLPSSSSSDSATTSLTCVQEASTHRIKGHEGVLDVAFDKTGAVAVTAGADGTVRVWEK
ncbi:hypothetical protein JCM8097_003038 [Rhodosporidiobolus ruineniae]